MNDFIRMERHQVVTEAVYALRRVKYANRGQLPPNVAKSLHDLEQLFNKINRQSTTNVTHEQIAQPIEIAHAFLELTENAPCAR